MFNGVCLPSPIFSVKGIVQADHWQIVRYPRPNNMEFPLQIYSKSEHTKVWQVSHKSAVYQ